MRIPPHKPSIVLSLALVVSAVPTAAPAQLLAQFIAITTDTRSPVCACYVARTNPSNFYIVAQTLSGFRGVEFSITGFPKEGYAYQATPNPNAVAVGDPFEAGTQIAFPECQTGLVTLFTVTMVRLAEEVQPFIGGVSPHAFPSNPNFSCPRIAACDAPSFTPECVPGSEAGSGPLVPLPSNPSPAHDATNVSRNPILRWDYVGPAFTCCEHQGGYGAVYFGTDPSPPRVFEGRGNERAYDPGVLQPFTTYYWKIESCPEGLATCSVSPVWSFTTGETIAVERRSWQGVKRLYQ